MKKPTKRRAALSYASSRAWNCLKMLCVPNQDLKFRIHHAFSELIFIDADYLPEEIRMDYTKLWDSLMGRPKYKYKSETLPEANVREMSWKKRQKAAETIAFVCARIFEAWGEERMGKPVGAVR